MTVNIDKKAGTVTITGIPIPATMSTGINGKEIAVPVDAQDRAMLSSALDALNKAHTATQLDDAKLDAMVVAKQAEIDAIKAARPVVVAASVK